MIVFYNTNCGLVVRGKNLHFIDASPSCLKLSLLFNFNTEHQGLNFKVIQSNAPLNRSP